MSELILSGVLQNFTSFLGLSLLYSALFYLAVTTYFDRRGKVIKRLNKTLLQIEKNQMIEEEESGTPKQLEALFENYKLRVESNLEKADVLLTKEEYMILNLVGIFIGYMVGALLLGSHVFGFILAAIGFNIPYFRIKQLQAQKIRLLDEQLEDVLTNLISSLKAGNDVTGSIKLVSEEMAYPSNMEFRKVYKEIRFGKPIDVALSDLKTRVNLEDYDFLINSILIQYEMGGRIVDLLGRLAGKIRSRKDTAQQIRKATAEGKANAWVMSLMPVILCVVFSLINPEFQKQMLGSFIGGVSFVVALVLYLIGLFLVIKIYKGIFKQN